MCNRLLMVNGAFLPSTSYGGAPYFIHSLSKNISKYFERIFIFASDAYDKKNRVIIKHDKIGNNIFVQYFRNVSNNLAYKFKIFLSPLMYIKMWRMKDSYDIIHLHDLRTIQTLFALIMKKKYNKKLILQPHGTFQNYFEERGLVKSVFDKLFLYDIMNNLDGLIAINNFEKVNITKRFKNFKKITVIPLAQDNCIYCEQRSNIYSNVIDKNKKIKFLFLGRKHQIKNLKNLIIGFKKFLSENDGHLTICGPDDGVEGKLLEYVNTNKLNAKITFLPNLDEEEKHEIFQKSDVLILPSIYETFPMVVLEAWKHKLGVILTNNSGISDLTEEFSAGLLTDGSASSICNMMKIYENDKNKLKKNALNGFKLYNEKFNWDVVSEQYKNYYRKICNFNPK